MVRPRWQEFDGDFSDSPVEIDRDRLTATLKTYLSANNIEADWAAVADASTERLVTTLAMIFPFEASEKQALLECATVAERAETVMTLMELSAAEKGDPSHARH